MMGEDSGEVNSGRVAIEEIPKRIQEKLKYISCLCENYSNFVYKLHGVCAIQSIFWKHIEQFKAMTSFHTTNLRTLTTEVTYISSVGLTVNLESPRFKLKLNQESLFRYIEYLVRILVKTVLSEPSPEDMTASCPSPIELNGQSFRDEEILMMTGSSKNVSLPKDLTMRNCNSNVLRPSNERYSWQVMMETDKVTQNIDSNLR